MMHLRADESSSIHDALGKRWQDILRNEVLCKNHGEVIAERHHEHLEKVHDYEQLEVSAGKDLPGHGHHGRQRERRLLRTLGIFFRGFTIKSTLAVEARVQHANAGQYGHNHAEALEGSKVVHVLRDETAEQHTGGAQKRRHLAVFNQPQSALMVSGDFCEEGALG